MGSRSRRKGAVGEREWAAFLSEHGFPAHRGRQYHGGPGTPDVECPSLRGRFHFEVKRVERLSLYDAMEQAEEDAPPLAVPVVAHRRNNHDWVVILRAEDWIHALHQDG